MGKTDSNNSKNNQKISFSSAEFAPDFDIDYTPVLNAANPIVKIIENLQEAGVIKLTLPKNQEERIRKWVEMNIPNSPYKPHYVKAFKIVLSLEDPNSMKQVDVVEKVFDEFEPNFKKQSLRKRIRPFLNSFEVDK